MDPKLLTEAAWKTNAQKFKLKDTTVQKALFLYGTFDENEYDDRFKGLAAIINFAGKAKALPEIKAVPVLVKYLTDMVAAAQAEQREVTKAKGAAQKAELAEAKAEAAQAKVEALKAKAEAEAARRADEENEESEEDEEEGDYVEKLKKALNNLKTAKQPYHFIVCDSKPFCGVMICKQVIGAAHRTELTTVTGGGKTFLKPGTCRREGTTLIFDMPNPPSGLAAKIMKSLKNFTTLKFKVVVGNESADEDEEVPIVATPGTPGRGGEMPAQPEAPPPVSPKLAKAPEAWRSTQRSVTASVKQLQAAVRKSLAGEAPKLIAEIEDSVSALDGIAEMLGNELPDILNEAIAAKDLASRNAELKQARTLLSGYQKYAKGPGAQLIAHIDSNPFGVKTNLKKTLTDGLTEMSEAIGAPE